MFGRLQLAAPFDFELSCRVRCLASPPEIECWKGRDYHRVVAWGGGPALLRLKSCGVVDRPQVEWRLDSPLGGDLAAADVAVLVQTLLSAEVDLSACYSRFASDPVLSALTQRWPGLRIVRSPSPYEALLDAVLEQQLGPAQAAQRKLRFARALGSDLDFGGRHYFGYPRPEVLARLRPADLSGPGVPLVPARALIAIARAALAKTLQALPDTEAAGAEFIKLRGVGRWSAETALLRGLGRPDALPADDPTLRRAIAALYRVRFPVTALAARRRWSKIQPWRGYAALYALASEQLPEL